MFAWLEIGVESVIYRGTEIGKPGKLQDLPKFESQEGCGIIKIVGPRNYDFLPTINKI